MLLSIFADQTGQHLAGADLEGVRDALCREKRNRLIPEDGAVYLTHEKPCDTRKSRWFGSPPRSRRRESSSVEG